MSIGDPMKVGIEIAGNQDGHPRELESTRHNLLKSVQSRAGAQIIRAGGWNVHRPHKELIGRGGKGCEEEP